MSSADVDKKVMNLGTTVETKKFGEIIVKELPIEKLPLLAEEMVRVMQIVQSNQPEEGEENEEKAYDWVILLLKNADLTKSIKRLLAASTGRKKEEFDELGMSDGVTLIRAFFAENSFDEVRELFFEMIEHLRGETTMTKSQEEYAELPG